MPPHKQIGGYLGNLGGPTWEGVRIKMAAALAQTEERKVASERPVVDSATCGEKYTS